MRGFNSDEVLNRAVRGTVRVMEDGNIRWSFVSVWAHDGLHDLSSTSIPGLNI